MLERAIDPDAPILLSDGGVIRAGYSAELDEYRDAAANAQELRITIFQHIAYHLRIMKAEMHLTMRCLIK